MKYLTIETQRFVVYYEQGGVVHREVFYNKEDIFSKFSSDEITEVNSNDPVIIEFRSKVLSKQLDDNFLNNLSSPIDDDVVCKRIMKDLFSRGSSGGNDFRMDEDKEYSIHLLDISIQEKDTFELLKVIFSNYEELRDHFNILNDDEIRKIYSIKDNDEELLKVAKRMVEVSNMMENYHTKLSKEDYKLYLLSGKLLDFRMEHIGTYDEINEIRGYDERIYLNCHNENVLHQFMTEYAKECIRHHIDYNCKGLYYNTREKTADTTILYSQNKDVKIRIKILENIMNKHPEWREVFCAPIYGGLTVGTGFYSLTHKGKASQTYSQHFPCFLKVVRGSFLAKILINNGLISTTDPNYMKLKNFSELSNIKKEDFSKIMLLKIDGEYAEKLCEIVEKYLDNSIIKEELMKISPDEFRDRAYKLNAIIQGFDPNMRLPIAFDKGMVDYFGYDFEKRKQVEEQKSKEPQTNIEKDNRTVGIHSESMKESQDMRETILAILKKLEKYILTGKSIEEKRAMFEIKRKISEAHKNGTYNPDTIVHIQSALNEYEVNDNDENLNKIRNLVDNVAKQTPDNNDDVLKEKIDALNSKMYDANKDDLISIDEVISTLSKICVKHMLGGKSFDEKRVMASLKQGLISCSQNGKYDIELIVQIKEAVDQCELLGCDDDLLRRLEALNQGLISSRENNKGVNKSQSMFKDASQQLFFSSFSKYKSSLLELMGSGLISEEPKELADLRTTMHRSFERTKGVNDELFDLKKYEAFREIITMIDKEMMTKIDIIKKGNSVKKDDVKKFE